MKSDGQLLSAGRRHVLSHGDQIVGDLFQQFIEEPNFQNHALLTGAFREAFKIEDNLVSRMYDGVIYGRWQRETNSAIANVMCERKFFQNAFFRERVQELANFVRASKRFVESQGPAATALNWLKQRECVFEKHRTGELGVPERLLEHALNQRAFTRIGFDEEHESLLLEVILESALSGIHMSLEDCVEATFLPNEVNVNELPSNRCRLFVSELPSQFRLGKCKESARVFCLWSALENCFKLHQVYLIN